jgi:hypothetical protein
MSFGDDTLDPANQDEYLERQSHDAEINRIGAALGLSRPTVEDIVKEIKKIKGESCG